MGWWNRLWGSGSQDALAPYEAVVAHARQPHWYTDGGVPDTVDGRFDMIAAVLTVVLLRRETEPAGAETSARITERFVDDMDAQLRQIGIGDMVVGKHMGRLMAALGGRLGAYRDGLASGDGAFEAALARNLYRGAPPSPAAVAHVAEGLRAWQARLAGLPVERIITGELA